ncbi:uncharacterized protein ASPGLDRAFT_122491 [Aspergillus glaucus CBS 516.65]|uniref:Uncharacterized protein n=1 Tax=Aspergillus glaucus CBS 516.65 TaxID=1160497 RepID=A0A1L9VPT8_ASPGL|nr:hypothetical protein ASPGLDRAFT_122491 [Aspergillus glaucus CBS 516.65]OJJ85929.1 hypothetical protein ASPGLDRAFT_122491 [Aspergillus glaucus CBS 516.65]
MASQDPGLQSLDPKLYSDDDDEEDIFWKRKLEALLNGDVTPSQAATDFDSCVVEEANTCHVELLKRPDPRSLTVEEEENGVPSTRAIAPNPSGNIELVFPWIATLCSAFPPHHEKQDKIIQFLEALRDMPKHDVYEGVPPENSDEPYNTTTLWPFGGNWMALAEVFRIETYEFSYPYSNIETPGSETQLRWRNFQSAIARLTSSGLINCSVLCALADILPSSQSYPDLEKRKVGGPNRVGGDVIAGAQWVLWPGQGQYVYQECRKKDDIDGPRQMWSMQHWKQWKEQFEFVAGDERFGEQARLVARLARHQMLAYEDE